MTSENLHKLKTVYGKSIFLLGILLIWGCGKTVETVSAEDNASLQPVEAEEVMGDNGAEAEKAEENLGPEIVEKEDPGNLQPEENLKEQERPKVRGIFVTGPMAGTDNMENLIDLVDRTELNAMVIDIKNDEGRVTYNMEIPSVQDAGSYRRYIRDMEALIRKCKEKDIYLIARIVAFKDPYMEQAKPEWCIHNKDGSLFKDKDGMTWLDPHNKQVWEYLLDIATEALDIGFDEIQFDYMRFSTDSGMENVDFVQKEAEEDRRQIITDFVKFASDIIHESGGAISADVYGVVIDSERDQKIVGQDYVELSKYLDYISPMVYPSHYGPYNYNIPVPDAEPYRLVLTAMQASRKVMAGVDALQEVNNLESGNLDAESIVTANTVSGNMQTEDMTENEEEEYSMEDLAALEPMDGVKAQVRPWLQDFTATWVKGHISYGADEIRAQIQGVYDAGYEEWILWNASNRYTEEGLMKDE